MLELGDVLAFLGGAHRIVELRRFGQGGCRRVARFDTGMRFQLGDDVLYELAELPAQLNARARDAGREALI